MNVYKKVLSALTLIVLLGSASPVYASHGLVVIDDTVLSRCGRQGIPFSGTATLGEDEELVIRLDGTIVPHTLDGSMWMTGFVTTEEGGHTLTATILADSTIVDATLLSVNVVACSDGGGMGDNIDCCPGLDEDTPGVSPAKTGAVKGITTVNLSERLQPLNSIFRSVYDRDPTFEEWEYWANRLLNDKSQYDALYGAMQWHQLRGRTIGDPVPMSG